MKISELIQELKAIKEEHGNLCVGVPIDDEFCDYTSIFKVNIIDDQDISLDDDPVSAIDYGCIAVIEI